VHNISQSRKLRPKPGEAMPGPYSSLMVLRRHASRSGPGRGAQGRKTEDNSDSALIRLLTSNKAYRTRRDAARAVVTRDFVVRRRIVSQPCY